MKQQIILEQNGCASISRANGQQQRIGVAWEYDQLAERYIARVFGDSILIIALSLETLQRLVNEYLRQQVNTETDDIINEIY